MPAWDSTGPIAQSDTVVGGQHQRGNAKSDAGAEVKTGDDV
jgi:hypothetical protein